MAEVSIKFTEKDLRVFLSDIVPKVIESKKISDEELILDVEEKSIKAEKKGDKIYLKGKSSEIVLTVQDLKKIAKLL